MFLTIGIQINNAPEVLEEKSRQFTSSMIDLATAQKPALAAMSPDQKRILIRKARALARRWEKHPEDQTPVPLECLWPASAFTLDAATKTIELDEENMVLTFKTDHYRRMLLYRMRPISLRVAKRDQQWYGWLMGTCSPDEYERIRNNPHRKKRKNDQKSQTGSGGDRTSDLSGQRGQGLAGISESGRAGG